MFELCFAMDVENGEMRSEKNVVKEHLAESKLMSRACSTIMAKSTIAPSDTPLEGILSSLVGAALAMKEVAMKTECEFPISIKKGNRLNEYDHN